jgi:hypothetical protein
VLITHTTQQSEIVMYELTLAHLTTVQHERDLEADLRQRRILKASDDAGRTVAASAADTAAVSASRKVPATRWVRTAGR